MSDCSRFFCLSNVPDKGAYTWNLSENVLPCRLRIAIALALLLANIPTTKALADIRPNIILIVADDLGYGDLTSYGGSIPTPNIDSLAEQGVRFTDFHSNAPVCTPTRAAILTGRYPERAQLTNALGVSSTIGLHPDQITIADLLKPAGYQTAIVGKWHLGRIGKFKPAKQGFNFFFGFLNGEIDYVNHLDSLGKPDWWKNSVAITKQEYSATAITNESIKFMKRNATRPFFLMTTYQTPHAPFQAPGDPAVRIADQPKGPPPEGNPAAYPAMVQAMDQGIGKIIATLRSLNLESKTLVFFMSDNGAVQSGGRNLPLRGWKGQLYEGGHRVPAIAYWPGTIAPAASAETLATIDIFPSLLELAQVAIPEGHRIDGLSFAPVLLRGEPMPARQLFWLYEGTKAVREANWKLAIIKGIRSLFDLDTDLGEMTDLSASYPDKVASMSAAHQAWQADVMSIPPVSVSLTATPSGTAAPVDVQMTAEAASSELLARVEFWLWTNPAKLLNTDKTAPYLFNWQGVQAGTYTVRAKATNIQGRSAVSAPIVLTVDPSVSLQVKH